MLRDGQELHVGIAHLTDIIAKLVSQFPPREPAVAFLLHAHPGTGVDFVN